MGERREIVRVEATLVRKQRYNVRSKVNYGGVEGYERCEVKAAC